MKATPVQLSHRSGRKALTPSTRVTDLGRERTVFAARAGITRVTARLVAIRPALALLLLLAGFLVPSTHASDAPRGGRVGWARLVTENHSWSVHNGNDPMLAEFIREHTSLNIDPTCYPVDPRDLEKLCVYPFVFTNNLTNVHAAKTLENLREYLKRGGFIYIDRCVNLSYSLEQETFYSLHAELFARFLPGSELRQLPPTHEINRCYFTSDVILERTAKTRGHTGIYGVFYQGRMVILLSNANLQCGWPDRNKKEPAMRMIANIYVYAMTR